MIFIALHFSFPVWALTDSSTRQGVSTSFSIVQSLVQKVLPKNLHVQSLVPIERDPHDYKLTMKDVMDFKNTSVYFYFGAGVDDHLVPESDSIQKCKISKGLRLLQDSSQSTDPHAWQDPQQGILMAQQILNCSKKIFPSQATVMDQSFKKLSTELLQISKEFRIRFKSLPASRLKIVTTHAAFQYLQSSMGLQIYSLQGIHSHSEPSAKSFQGLIDLVKKHRIQYLFPEQPSLSVTFKRFQNLTSMKLGPRLYSDSLSPANGPASDYPSLVKHNLEMIYQQLASSEQLTKKENQ